MGDRSARRGRKNHFIILLIYIGVAVGMTWPLVSRLTTHLPGGTTDTLVHYWNGWWVGQALSAGQSPYQTPYLYYPGGLSLVYHNFAWGSILAGLPLQSLLGGFAAYNTVVLVNMALCGFAAFLLAHDLTHDTGSSFLAGLIYQCWPFRLSQLDHPNLISTQWIPLFLLFLIRTVRRGRKWDGVWTGLFLALVGYTRWQQLVPASAMGIVYLVCALPDLRGSWRRWLPGLLLAGTITFVILLPPVLLLVNQHLAAPADVLVEGDEIRYRTDLMAYITPSGDHPVLGEFTRPAYDRYYPHRQTDRRFPAYVGITTLALAGLGLWQARRSGLPWAVTAIVLVLLALGPELLVNGQAYPSIPMVYRLVARLVVVRLLRVPDRFNLFLALPVAMMAAYGGVCAKSYVQKRGRLGTIAGLCLIIGVILFEYLSIPVSVQRPTVSAFYAQLAAEADGFAVLNLPRDAQESKKYMFAQTTHNHPILQGKTARFPPGTFDYLDSQPWLQALRHSSTMPPGHNDVSRQLGTLAQDGVRYVILHKKSRSPLRLAQWRRYFAIPPRFEDDRIIVYPTVPEAGRDFELIDEPAPGIGPVVVVTPTNCLSPGRILGLDVAWGTTEPPGRDLDVKIGLAMGENGTRHEQVFPLSSGLPVAEWPANSIFWERYELRIPPSRPSGAYTVTLTLMDSHVGAAQGRPIQLGVVTVNESACALPLEPDAIRVDALFGLDLHLLGYQHQRQDEQLTLTLHWRSERLMEVDYKVFVHVFDPASDLRVAQDDAMPLRWTYPTTYWPLGKVVLDGIPLSLENAPAGDYMVAVGVYDPQTMKRLSVIDSTGQPQPDNQMILPGDVIVGEGDGS